MGLNYLHANDTDLHLYNFLLCVSGFDNLSTTELYECYGKPYEIPTQHLDGKASIPHAPPHVIYPMIWNMPANEVTDPEVIISDYRTSFIVSKTPSPTLHMPALYSPLEELFNKHITTVAGMWDMGWGETPETCEWDVADGEFKALEDMLRAIMTFEPAERPAAKQLMASEYMVKWAMTAWEADEAKEVLCCGERALNPVPDL
ncbi:hypothetical protein D8B26_003243 [Coccidioides posadasii str. Silveira]|uniref:Uncharacterized protein n=1 Tax=Coccidioides posadasii (strain RMSCC 757 / Silveira) TaxID=443226 RepID=E9D0B1_COCPS|nr:conserved hypothetical protein [Coccidioides posadasii str. Silveira]QVM08557.1 hypothetical protein D8B26_003243 [Coccidioides posadasii str. Silveira]